MKKIREGQEVWCQGCENQELVLSGFTKAGCTGCLQIEWQSGLLIGMLIDAQQVFQTMIEN